MPTNVHANGCKSRILSPSSLTNLAEAAFEIISFSPTIFSLLSGWLGFTSLSSVVVMFMRDQGRSVSDRVSKQATGVLPPLTIRETICCFCNCSLTHSNMRRAAALEASNLFAKISTLSYLTSKLAHHGRASSRSQTVPRTQQHMFPVSVSILSSQQ